MTALDVQVSDARHTALQLPLTSMEAISSQGVKRATGLHHWYEAAPSLDALVNRESLFIGQRIAETLPAARTRSEMPGDGGEASESCNIFNDSKFRGGKVMTQKPGRPISALPKVWSDTNPWSDKNGAIERSRFSNRLKIGSLPTDHDPPEEKITQYTRKYHHKFYSSRTSKCAPVWFAPVKNADRHIFEKLEDDNPPEWFVDASTENPFPSRSAVRTGGINNPAVGPEAGKQWSVTSLAAPEFMQIKGEPKRKVCPEGRRRLRPMTSGGRIEGSCPGTTTNAANKGNTADRSLKGQAHP